jgi:hypothetical protein
VVPDALIVLSLLMASGVTSLPPAQCGSTVSTGGEAGAARKVEMRMTAEVLVNGRGPYKFIVDTSADSSAIGLKIAHDLQLPMGRPAILNGMTSRQVIDRFRIDQLTIGRAAIRNLQLPALPEQDLGGDGLIGSDAFGKQQLVMDFEKGLVAIEDESRPTTPGEFTVAARHQRGRLIVSDLNVSGLPVDAVIHTGSEISIGNFALRDKFKNARFGSVEVAGVGGTPVKMPIARVGELQIGPLVLREVPIAFADATPFRAWGLSDKPALMLGTDVLSRFSRVSLDFRESKVRFEPRRCASAE